MRLKKLSGHLFVILSQWVANYKEFEEPYPKFHELGYPQYLNSVKSLCFFDS